MDDSALEVGVSECELTFTSFELLDVDEGGAKTSSRLGKKSSESMI